MEVPEQGLVSGPLLSLDLLQLVAGEDDLETVEDIEIIFDPIAEIANLNRCVNLRSLTLINVGLQRISNLACVGRSLERLALIENRISRIEGLYLPQLRELYLQGNSICRIEGLEACPRLQRLWLMNNRIVKIENLHPLADLRELCLQGNRISRIQNLEPLANLEALHLAENRIADFKDLQRLSHLPALVDLSLVDADHGSNPVVRADGYTEFVLCTLKHVQRLDGEPISAKSRSVAEETYMQRVLAFNDRVDQVRRENERELLAIEARRQRNLANADGLRVELQGAFRELETTIHEGRSRILAEHQRQTRVRKANLQALQKSLDVLRRQHAAGIERIVAGEAGRMKAEEAWFRAERCKIIAERDAAIFLARSRPRPQLPSPSKPSAVGAGGFSPTIACQDLSEHVPDYRFIAAHFRAASANSKAAAAGKGARDGGQHDDDGALRRRQLSVLKVFKMHNEKLNSMYEEATARRGASAAGRNEDDDTERLYVGGSVELLRHISLHGFASWPFARSAPTVGPDAPPIVLYTDPTLAVEMSARAAATAAAASSGSEEASKSDAKSDGDGDSDRQQSSSTAGTAALDPAQVAVGPHAVHTVLLCRVALGRVHTLYGTRAQGINPSRELAAQIPPECQAGQVNYGSGQSAGAFYLMRQDSAPRIFPECYLLVQESPKKWPGGISLDNSKLERLLAELTMPMEATAAGREVARLTAEFDRKTQKEMQRYEHRVFQEMDPETAEQLQQSEAEVLRLRETLQELRSQIDSEKGLQERILREFRATFTEGDRPVRRSSNSGTGRPSSRGGR